MTAAWIRPPVPLLVGAHRGLGAGLPENTLAGATATLDLGVDFVETDLRLTRDGVAVALHDATFARISGDPRAVADLAFDEAVRLKPDLPTVAAMIERVASRDRALLLDLKLERPKDLARALEPLSPQLATGRAALGVRSLAVARAIGEIAPGAPIVGLLREPAELPALADLGARWARLWQDDATAAAIADLKRRGLAVLIMAGRPNPREVGFITAYDLSRLIADGVDAVMLDDPALALRLRDGRPPADASSGL
ncbi:MAG: hypothetical protein LWW93_13240 [Hyphomicrobiales bacterium]|nr:hypothetical protein [Hyphomicrobiales bacterium]